MSDSSERRGGVDGAEERSVRVPRRVMLRGGLAGFAAVMMSRALPGCGPDGPLQGMDGGQGRKDAGGGLDAAMPDAGPFPVRNIPEPPALISKIADIGDLRDPDENGLRLPEGFSSRVIATTNELVEGTNYRWHVFPDGGATFATEDGGWIYVSNCETPSIGTLSGGVGAVRFDASGAIVGASRILDGTNINCAGGKTPWHTWLSCEEIPKGKVYECDPWGVHPSIARPALGVFKHEAAAVDPVRGHVFLTEDVGDGCFYRFVPDRLTELGHPDLAAGRLEVAKVASDGAVTWLPLPDPQFEGEVPTREQVPEATAFRGGEGIWYHADRIYFSTKGDDHIRVYDAVQESISVLYDGSDPGLQGVDNLTVSCCGDVLVAEDGGSMQIVAILPDGTLKPLVQVVDNDLSEITGPAFDPSGTRLYFSSQRGPGRTYEITGPFHVPMP